MGFLGFYTEGQTNITTKILLSISFDSEEDKQKWKDFVKERNLKDPQLWVDSKNHKIFSDAFNMQMIPRFTFIDDKGKIIDAKAPRPSESVKVRNLIDEQFSKWSTPHCRMIESPCRWPLSYLWPFI